MTLKGASTEEFLPICNVGDVSSSSVEEPSDDDINYAYNLFDAEKMKYFRNVFVRLNRDFRRRKTANQMNGRTFQRL